MRLVVMVIAATLATSVDAQETLRALARQNGDFTQRVTVSYEPVSMQQLVQRSALIARVVVLSASPTLLESQQRIATDLTAQPLSIMRSPAGLVTGPTIMIRQIGGSLVFEGHRVTTEESGFPLLEIGKEYVLFLTKSPVLDRFEVVSGPQGTFEATGDSLKQVSPMRELWPDDSAERTSIDTKDFERRLHTAVAELSKKDALRSVK